jgi:hypothetical protein
LLAVIFFAGEEALFTGEDAAALCVVVVGVAACFTLDAAKIGVTANAKVRKAADFAQRQLN